MIFRSLLCVIILFNRTQCAKILAIFTWPSKSHTILGVKLAEGLIKRGHEVTIVSPHTCEPIAGLTQIRLIKMHERIEQIHREKKFSFMGAFHTLTMMKTQSTEMSQHFWEEQEIQKIIKVKPKYDVMISTIGDATLGLAHHLQVPYIFFSVVGSTIINNLFVGNPNMVYVPNIMFPVFPNTFIKRLYTVTVNIAMQLSMKLFIYPSQREILKKYLPECPPFEDLLKNVSLVLLNSHFSIEPPRPLVPNAIQIGGFHLDQTKQLPQEFKAYLDSSQQGAIVFSLGTNVRIATFREDILKAIFKVLGEFSPMKVLFKSELEHKDLPENIMVKKWLPQAEILAHPNIRAFISHGGLGSNTEAVYHGVPIVGIPFFGDQHMNIQQAELAGYAVSLEYEHLNEDLFRNKVKEILENPRYRENAKKRSALMKGQLIKPMDNAAFWIEHIIKYGSGSHLRNDGMDLSWYQLYMVDIYIFYTMIICFISFIAYKSMKILYKFIRRIMSKNHVKIKET